MRYWRVTKTHRARHSPTRLSYLRGLGIATPTDAKMEIRCYGIGAFPSSRMKLRMRQFVLLVHALALAFPTASWAAAPAQEPGPGPGTNGEYYGNFSVAPDHMIGIDRFINDAGDTVALISDYQSGVVRRLFPVSETESVMGPGFDVQSPPELRVRFVRDSRRNVTGLSLQWANGTTNSAKRVPLMEQEVIFTDGAVRLAGTLMLPATKGPHPAIVLLHGSGPLTRYSFGPYPHFFTSLGFAVLIYDKRGTGASTGTRVDASTGDLAHLPAEYYPEGLEDDALAAFRYLQGRKEINPKEIGVWGSSEGGMLATQAASRNKDIAFAICSSGFMGPLWETLYYQAARGRGLSAAQADEVLAFTRLWMKVARTGNDYELFLKQREEARKEKPWLFSYTSADFTSLEQMRWTWVHILSFSPLPALSQVACPVLGLWGELDQSTDAAAAQRNMRAALSKSGNRDVTTKVFPNASHPLMEMPSGSRMAPGVFETLRSWLLQRVRVP
jgi:pimeloyl-ACP methyl ester carboxylesterase